MTSADAAANTEAAKRLLKSGAIQLKVETKTTFKRSSNLKRRLTVMFFKCHIGFHSCLNVEQIKCDFVPNFFRIQNHVENRFFNQLQLKVKVLRKRREALENLLNRMIRFVFTSCFAVASNLTVRLTLLKLNFLYFSSTTSCVCQASLHRSCCGSVFLLLPDATANVSRKEIFFVLFTDCYHPVVHWFSYVIVQIAGVESLEEKGKNNKEPT